MAEHATREDSDGRAGYARAGRDWVYGALDLGTNNCRLLVARPAGAGFKVVDAFSRIVRLGEGLSASGRLSEAAQRRALAALKICAAKLARRRVRHVRAVATEACRRASNCQAFLERVRREAGIELEIIGNDEEARLALHGCAPLLDRAVPHALVFDIGGGSTEIACMEVPPGAPEFPPRTPTLSGCHSIPIGVVTLAERHGGREVAARGYRAMIEEVRAALAPFEAARRLAPLIADGGLQMLGTSGTVTTLAGIHQGLARYDRDRVDGLYLDFDTARALSRRIAAMSYEARQAHPCIGRERADLVVAGCAILEAVCATWPVGRLRVADRGLREGILYRLMGALGQGEVARPEPAALPDRYARPSA